MISDDRATSIHRTLAEDRRRYLIYGVSRADEKGMIFRGGKLGG